MQYKVTHPNGAPLFVPNWQRNKRDGLKADYEYNSAVFLPLGTVFDVLSVSAQNNGKVGRMADGKSVFISKGGQVFAEPVIVSALADAPIVAAGVTRAEFDALAARVAA